MSRMHLPPWESANLSTATKSSASELNALLLIRQPCARRSKCLTGQREQLSGTPSAPGRWPGMGGFGQPQRDLPHSEALVDMTADLAHDLPRTPRSRVDQECFLDSDSNPLETGEVLP